MREKEREREIRNGRRKELEMEEDWIREKGLTLRAEMDELPKNWRWVATQELAKDL